jgi:formate dehydrogenase major subunit
MVNPTAAVYSTDADAHATCDPRYPLCGHHLPGHRALADGVDDPHPAWLMELQPQMFVEMSEELARLKGIQNGERVNVKSARGKVECSAIVTKRFKPFHDCRPDGSPGGHSLALWLAMAVSGKEESANLLTPSAGDPNTRIPETKAFMVNVVKV